MTHTFHVKNFEQFQHYKDRTPPWIKLYNSLLDDYAFACLQDASKLHLIAIWLLASRSENKLPYDPKWIAKRINATDKVDLDGLLDSGFIVLNQELQSLAQDASAALAKRLPREREEGETETETEKNSRAVVDRTRAEMDFQDFWAIFPKRAGGNPKNDALAAFRKAVKAGTDPADIIAGAELYARYCAAVGNLGTQYVKSAVAWLNKRMWEDEWTPPIQRQREPEYDPFAGAI